jgi:acetyl-CoA synthetase
MADRSVFPISEQPHIGKIDEAGYFRLYRESLADPDRFWGEAAKRLSWIKPYSKVCGASFAGDVTIRWYEDGTLNASYNCIDRHLAKRADQTAILWEGDDPAEDRRVTYRELHESVCRLANALKAEGVKKGDRVTIYMPMIPEAAVAMLACARIGAVHSVIFGGFSSESVRDRVNDAQAKVLITADGGYRRGQVLPLKRMADGAMAETPSIEHCIVVRRRPGGEGDEAFATMTEGRDHWWHRLLDDASSECEPEPMDAEDMLFTLYTSGTTGKPKGIVHTTGGYLTQVACTTKYVFDLKPEDVFWCTADVGWVTGHSYVVTVR